MATPEDGHVIVTIDVPTDWTPWSVIRLGAQNGHGWTAEIPRALWEEWLDIEPRWQRLQHALRTASPTVQRSAHPQT